MAFTFIVYFWAQKYCRNKKFLVVKNLVVKITLFIVMISDARDLCFVFLKFMFLLFQQQHSTKVTAFLLRFYVMQINNYNGRTLEFNHKVL